MRIWELFEGENDRLHQRHLDKTGFWGARGAGCIFMAKDTKHFLIAHRSMSVEQPGTWGTWGGAIDPNETPLAAAKREAQEEAGFDGNATIVPLYVFEAKKNGKVVFQYHNFLAVVKEEFVPKMDWETQGYRWVVYGDWPYPLHFGLKALLDDANSVREMKKAARGR